MSMQATALLAAFGLGCGEDTINTIARTPPGQNPGTNEDPIAFSVGQSFTYSARLDHRSALVGQEGNVRYSITMTITAVTDAGEDGPSSLQVATSKSNTFRDEWDAPRDFDSWMAQLGPTLQEQADSMDERVDLVLSDFPAKPGRDEAGRDEASAGAFFIDVRKIEDLQQMFLQRHADQNPRIVSPDSGAGNYVFIYSGDDPTVSDFYPSSERTRSITLTYDPTGFLRSMEEIIGEDAPKLTASMSLDNP